MKRKISAALFMIIIFQMAGCISIYRSVRDKRDKSYKEGVELFNQNKIEEANEKFETVVDIEPDYRDARQYLAQTKRLLSMRKRNIKHRANVNYDTGVALMRKGRYDEALPLLIAAKEQDSDHPDADLKIEECRKKLEPRFEALLKIADQQYNRAQYIPAYNTCLRAKIYNPTSVQLFTTMRKIESKLNDNASKYVSKGKQFYDKKQYQAALNQFKIAQQANPWDKDIRELLDKTNARINLDKNYQNGITQFNKGDYFGSKFSFNQVNYVEPNYKDTAKYLARINSALAGQVGYFYSSGVAYYDKGNFESAVAEFNKVLSINPAYPNAQEYRQRAQAKLEMQKSVGGAK